MNINLPGYFRIAKTQSKLSTHNKQLGAVISYHRPISLGYNKQRTHPKYANGEKCFSIHAEIDALIKCKVSPQNATLWVFREDEHGNPALAKPCSECMKYIIDQGIKRIYFTTNTYPYYERIDL